MAPAVSLLAYINQSFGSFGFRISLLSLAGGKKVNTILFRPICSISVMFAIWIPETQYERIAEIGKLGRDSGKIDSNNSYSFGFVVSYFFNPLPRPMQRHHHLGRRRKNSCCWMLSWYIYLDAVLSTPSQEETREEQFSRTPRLHWSCTATHIHTEVEVRF